MFGMPMLEVLIGLVFIYLLLSLICTAINEMVAGVRDSREKHLRAGITNLFCEGTSQKLAQLDIVPLRNPLTGETTKHGAVALCTPADQGAQRRRHVTFLHPSRRFCASHYGYVCSGGWQDSVLHPGLCQRR